MVRALPCVEADDAALRGSRSDAWVAGVVPGLPHRLCTNDGIGSQLDRTLSNRQHHVVMASTRTVHPAVFPNWADREPSQVICRVNRSTWHRDPGTWRVRGLVTAGPTHPVEFARTALELLGVFTPDVLGARYRWFGGQDPSGHAILAGAQA